MDSSIAKLTEFFGRFPGIGPKQAKRFVFFLLNQDKEVLKNFTTSVMTLKDNVRQCPDCFRYFTSSNGQTLCDICRDPNRDSSLLMVVEKDIDLDNIRRSGAYEGKFFILGGTIPLLDHNPYHRIRLKELQTAIAGRTKAGHLKEIILALSANAEGDYTADRLKEMIDPLIKDTEIKLSTLGRGLSTGSELEYSDGETIRNAFLNRH